MRLHIIIYQAMAIVHTQHITLQAKLKQLQKTAAPSDILYAHPSSNKTLIASRGAFVTLWDINRNQDLVPEIRSLKTPVNVGSVRMCVGVSDVEVTFLEDDVCGLIVMFGTAVDGFNSVNDAGAGKNLLRTIHTILSFSASNIRRSLEEVMVRSDLDGMIICALYRVSANSGDRYTVHDIQWSRIIPSYKKDTEMDMLEREIMHFEAAEYLDDVFRLFPRLECYVLGACLYHKQMLMINHLSAPLHDPVYKYLLLHKNGFRSEKDLDKQHVIKCYPKNVGITANDGASYYLLWTSSENLLLCCLLETYGTGESADVMLFGTILSSMRTLIGKPDVRQKAAEVANNSFGRFAQHSNRSSFDQDKMVTGTLVRTTSAPNVAQKFTLVNEKSHGQRPASLSQAPRLFSMSSENLTRQAIAGAEINSRRRSGIIFSVTISGKSQSMVLESLIDEYSRNSFLPPKLFDDFIRHIPILRNLFTSTLSHSEEITLLLEYPSPSLFKRYWISGRILDNPLREIFLCYQEGSETAVALDYLMKM
ncbi:uncharacterized protein LOC129584896 isoform X2 [Paramacrobiotus metropolitanus]|uniref:uncharacterized protein LOC129584896 isoform X2 n=1 Tax=Paramacrobiotus metropolitanus TaxID=2943436 RepID=UPI0024462DD6|nr:uncharacterized protein LOC129584896 isoform X2 [Paramacrobiotus metropolitanus]